MKFTILFVLIVCFVAKVYTQSNSNYIDYFLTVDSVQEFKRQNQYQKSVETYKSAFKMAEARGHDYLSLATCYVHLGEREEALSYLKKAMVLGIPKRYINSLRDLKKEEESHSSFWKEVDEVYPQLRKEFLSKINIEGYIELKVLKRSDQDIRRDLMTQEVFSSDSLMMNYAAKVDLNNLEKLLEIIERDGRWPGSKSYGDAETGSYFVLVHFESGYVNDEKKFDRIFQILYQKAKEGVFLGELTPYQFA